MRWLLVYAIYQVLRRVATVPKDDIEEDEQAKYHLFAKLPEYPPWEDTPAMRAQRAPLAGRHRHSMMPFSNAAFSPAVPSAPSRVQPDVAYGSMRSMRSRHMQTPEADENGSPLGFPRRRASLPSRPGGPQPAINRASTLRRSFRIFGREFSSPPNGAGRERSPYHEIIVLGYGNGTNQVNLRSGDQAEASGAVAADQDNEQGQDNEQIVDDNDQVQDNAQVQEHEQVQEDEQVQDNDQVEDNEQSVQEIEQAVENEEAIEEVDNAVQQNIVDSANNQAIPRQQIGIAVSHDNAPVVQNNQDNQNEDHGSVSREWPLRSSSYASRSAGSAPDSMDMAERTVSPSPVNTPPPASPAANVVVFPEEPPVLKKKSSTMQRGREVFAKVARSLSGRAARRAQASGAIVSDPAIVPQVPALPETPIEQQAQPERNSSFVIAGPRPLPVRNSFLRRMTMPAQAASNEIQSAAPRPGTAVGGSAFFIAQEQDDSFNDDHLQAFLDPRNLERQGNQDVVPSFEQYQGLGGLMDYTNGH